MKEETILHATDRVMIDADNGVIINVLASIEHEQKAPGTCIDSLIPRLSSLLGLGNEATI